MLADGFFSFARQVLVRGIARAVLWTCLLTIFAGAGAASVHQGRHQAQRLSVPEGHHSQLATFEAVDLGTLDRWDDRDCSFCESIRSAVALAPPIPAFSWLIPVSSAELSADSHPWMVFSFGAYSSRAPPVRVASPLEI